MNVVHNLLGNEGDGIYYSFSEEKEVAVAA
jgi:hypothetical protein